MCNLYGHTSTQEAMARLFKPNEVVDRLGNYEPQPEIYPDQLAPIMRAEGDQIILQTARCGLPTPETYLEGHAVDRGVTNIRNTSSPHWRRWLGTAHRCLVPLTSFAEPAGKGKGNVWFHLAD
ncbi:SOS response-associated peptidase family protein [Ketogulonicigenium vulgare]|uniref:SOS response-associated peptidase family protein n=1 Tax=Ketogulonicigenium vulgare TaxID=92945 RepID=UPI0023590E01|nr:SOS response-associated peptidase family protein [Ketogulonicigenium vulgare]